MFVKDLERMKSTNKGKQDQTKEKTKFNIY